MANMIVFFLFFDELLTSLLYFQSPFISIDVYTYILYIWSNHFNNCHLWVEFYCVLILLQKASLCYLFLVTSVFPYSLSTIPLTNTKLFSIFIIMPLWEQYINLIMQSMIFFSLLCISQVVCLLIFSSLLLLNSIS